MSKRWFRRAVGNFRGVRGLCSPPYRTAAGPGRAGYLSSHASDAAKQNNLKKVRI